MMFQRDYPSSVRFLLSKNEHSPNCFVSLALNFPFPFSKVNLPYEIINQTHTV